MYGSIYYYFLLVHTTLLHTDGPDLFVGPHRINASLTETVSLFCGTATSNPRYTVSWRDSHGNFIQSGVNRRTIINEDNSIRLNISNFMISDEGVYTCIVSVQGSNVSTADGTIVPSILVGEDSHTIIVSVQSKYVNIAVKK